MPGVDDSIVGSLCDPARPTFLFGCTPPSEVTSEQEAIDVARKFADRGRVLAVDGYIVYDVQDESSRTDAKRPFPYRRLMEPSRKGSWLRPTGSWLRPTGRSRLIDGLQVSC